MLGLGIGLGSRLGLGIGLGMGLGIGCWDSASWDSASWAGATHIGRQTGIRRRGHHYHHYQFIWKHKIREKDSNKQYKQCIPRVRKAEMALTTAVKS